MHNVNVGRGSSVTGAHHRPPTIARQLQTFGHWSGQIRLIIHHLAFEQDIELAAQVA